VALNTIDQTKTGRHDIAEILLKVVLKHQKSKSKSLHIKKIILVIFDD
jgi:hypothetical protein